MIKIHPTKKQTLRYIFKYLKSPQNVITNIYRIDSYNDYPSFFQYATDYLPLRGKYEADLIPNGISFDKDTAFIKTVMETIERWYLSYYSAKDLVFNSYNNLKKKSPETLSPKLFAVINDKQLSSRKYAKFRFSEDTNLYWTKVRKLGGTKEVYAPAQLVFFMYDNKNEEPTIRIPDTSGAAAGTSIDQALYNAVCELVERDAYAIMYYNKTPAKKINLKKITDKNTAELIDYIEEHYFEISIFDITTDINIPTFLCVLVDKTNIGSKITVGIKCDLSWADAMRGAIMESLQGITVLRNIILIKKSMNHKFNRNIVFNRPILERMLYWTDPSSIDDLQFLLSQSTQSLEQQRYVEHRGFSYSEKLHVVVKILKEVGINNIYWKQIAPTVLEGFNFYGVKVLIPELQPISLDQNYLYFGGGRLYSVPVKLGFREKPIKSEELNLIPHPLP